MSYVRAVLTKRRLESFEIQVTSLEEATTEILSPVVEMICDTLPELAQSLNKLVVALELDGQQVGRQVHCWGRKIHLDLSCSVFFSFSFFRHSYFSFFSSFILIFLLSFI